MVERLEEGLARVGGHLDQLAVKLLENDVAGADTVAGEELLPEVAALTAALDADLLAAHDVMACCAMQVQGVGGVSGAAKGLAVLGGLLLEGAALAVVVAALAGAGVLLLSVCLLGRRSAHRRARFAGINLGLPTYGLSGSKARRPVASAAPVLGGGGVGGDFGGGGSGYGGGGGADAYGSGYGGGAAAYGAAPAAAPSAYRPATAYGMYGAASSSGGGAAAASGGGAGGYGAAAGVGSGGGIAGTGNAAAPLRPYSAAAVVAPYGSAGGAASGFASASGTVSARGPLQQQQQPPPPPWGVPPGGGGGSGAGAGVVAPPPPYGGYSGRGY